MNAANSLTELQEQIRDKYDDLSKRLQQVARYVLDNTNSVAFDTVAVVARDAEVPPSTLIRFANALGFSGFNEMKQLFRQNLLEETANYTDRIRLLKELDEESRPSEQPIDILQAFSMANAQATQQLAAQMDAKKLEAAVDILNEAENIYLIGLGRSFSVASYFTYALRHLNRRAFLIDGLGGMLKEQISMIGPKDVVIAVSFSPYAKETLMLSEVAAEKNAKQVIITDSQISPLAAFSEVCFVIKEAQVGAFRSLTASLSLAQTLVVSLAFRSDENNLVS